MRKPVSFKPVKTPKLAAIKPERSKNILEASANKAKALKALRDKVCLSLTYLDLHRVVEVHTVGTSTADRPAMSIFQVDGQSNEPPIMEFRLFRFDECFNVALTGLPSRAPRPEYKKRSKQFSSIDAEV